MLLVASWARTGNGFAMYKHAYTEWQVVISPDIRLDRVESGSHSTNSVPQYIYQEIDNGKYENDSMEYYIV